MMSKLRKLFNIDYLPQRRTLVNHKSFPNYLHQPTRQFPLIVRPTKEKTNT